MTKTMDKYASEYIKTAAKQNKALEKFVPTLPKWDGWVGSWKEEVTHYAGQNVTTRSWMLVCYADHVKLEFRAGGDGTTSFEVEGKGWLTFDRRGVESSFYWQKWDYPGAEEVIIENVMREQVKRVADRREYYKSAIVVPQIGFTVSPEGKVALIADIKKIGFRNFMPSGFGTGYTISTKHVRFSNRAKPELEEFIGVSPLYVSTFDAD